MCLSQARKQPFRIADPSYLLFSSPKHHLHTVSRLKYINSMGVCSPCLALSSENSLATSSNFTPSLSLASASSFFACFSHCKEKLNDKQRYVQVKNHTRMCRTFIDCAPLAFVSLSPASSFPFPLPFADLAPPFLSEGLLSPPFCLPILARRCGSRRCW